MKARQQKEKGMALVITLMMLAIVTFMAVVFLTVSRRERGAVKTAEEQDVSRRMADAGTAAATASVIGTIGKGAEAYLTERDYFLRGMTTNQQKEAIDNGTIQRAKLQYSLNVSRNYFQVNGSPTNVSLFAPNGKMIAYGTPDYLSAVAGLQYSPRVPVIANQGQTNEDFRFYLDLNRNGMFDPTTNSINTVVDGSGASYPASFHVGDPEWIGVLERPDLPHSETNRFIGRYAYIVLPEGKSLDINFIHNKVSGADDDLNASPVPGTNRFSRNQGVGFWEMNLAGFLVDFHNQNANTWPVGPNTYTYEINSGNGTATGSAFRDALGLLGYRMNSLAAVGTPTRQNLYTPDSVFVSAAHPQYSANNFWANDLVDLQGDGGYIHYQNWYSNNAPIKTKLLVDLNNPAKRWFGLDQPAKTGEYGDVQKYFAIGTTANANFSDFYKRFTNAVSSPRTNSYDRYAYYRFVSQMGADSVPAIQGRIHLNYTNEPGSISTNLYPWVQGAVPPVYAVPTLVTRPTYWETNQLGVFERQNTLTNFFLMTANEMLRRSLVTNVFIDTFRRWQTNYTIGGTYFTNANLNTRWELGTNRLVANLPVRHDISITNIQIYHQPLTLGPAQLLPFSYVTNNEYSSAMHRILQLAANIYDNMTNAGPAEPYFPSVWRPIYSRTATNLIISGFVMDPVASTFPTDWTTHEEFFFNGGHDGTRLNIYGQPVVIGAKKGWPNFNELSIETFVQVGRKLQLVKMASSAALAADPAAKPPINTNQMFTIGISNIFAIEAWNSYAKDFPRPLELRAQIVSDFRLTAGRNGTVTQVFSRSYTNNTSVAPFLVPANTWKAHKAVAPSIFASAQPNGSFKGETSDFRLPVYTNSYTLTNSEFLPYPPYFASLSPVPLTATFMDSLRMPDFLFHMTNRVYYIAVDKNYDRIVDFVNVERLVNELDITRGLAGVTNAANAAFGAGLNPGMFWDTNLVDKANLNSEENPTAGQYNQALISMGELPPDDTIWKSYNSTPLSDADRPKAIKAFWDWLGPYRNPQDPITNKNLMASTTQQAPYSPVRKLYLHTSYQVNDPFVHYMAADLRDPFEQPVEIISPPNTPKNNDELSHRNRRYQPWGLGPDDFAVQDYMIGSSDDWQFPIAKLDDPGQASSYGIPHFLYRYPNIGTLGRIHRGTPWQTVYLKSGITTMTNWAIWSGSWGTHPATDWKLLDIFTTAMTENAARGLLSVNQTNIAAWSAVLSGVQVITNSVPDSEFRLLPQTAPRFGNPKTGHDLVIEPSSIQLSNIVAGINRYRSTRPMGVFSYLGEILGTPELSMGYWPPPEAGLNSYLVASPYLNYLLYDKSGKPTSINTNQIGRAFTDDALEAIPQRILSLLKPDETRVVVYSFGQALKPAPRSLATSANFYNLCLNYQVTGEYATKTILRVDGDVRNTNNPVRTVIESFEQLPPFE